MLFWGDYYLRWWRLPIEERACRKTDLGGGDYYLRNSGLPPFPRTSFNLTHWAIHPILLPLFCVCLCNTLIGIFSYSDKLKYSL